MSANEGGSVMQGSRRKSLYLFHRSVGLVTAFLGAIVFFTGAVAVMHHEIDAWAQRGQREASFAGLAEGPQLDRAVASALEALPDRGEAASETGWNGVLRLHNAEELLLVVPVPGEEVSDFVTARLSDGTVTAYERTTFAAAGASGSEVASTTVSCPWRSSRTMGRARARNATSRGRSARAEASERTASGSQRLWPSWRQSASTKDDSSRAPASTSNRPKRRPERP